MSVDSTTNKSSSTSMGNPVNKIAKLLQEESFTPEPEEIINNDISDIPEEETPQDIAAEGHEEEAEELVNEQSIETLNDFAENLGVDISDMYNLSFKMQGDLPSMTLGELKNFYADHHDIEASQQTLTERESELEQERQRIAAIPKASNELIQAKAQVKAIELQYESTNWQELRSQNPAEYAALMADFNQRYTVAKQQEQAAQQQNDELLKQRKMIEQNRLLEAVPELKDDETRVKFASLVNKTGAKYGFSASEIDQIDDHRLIRMMIDLSNGNAAKETASQKKVKTTQKLQRPTKPRSPSQKAALKRLTDKARQGDNRDKARAITQLLGG